MPRHLTTVAASVALVCMCLTGTAAAQGQLHVPSWLSIDSSTSVDRSVNGTATAATGVVMDAVVSAQVSPHIELYARPFVQRLPNGEWNRQVWLAAARYERKGRIGLRVDAGLIPSPVGLANLTLRPHLNPTISQPASLFQGLPAPEPQSPRVTMLGAIYPYGVSATVSGLRWDARAAIVDSSPGRARRVFSTTNPPRFANVVVGGGVTPVTGLRVGASVTQGGWKRADELPLSRETLRATLVTIETEFSFRHSKVTAEWMRDTLDTTTGKAVADGWYLQGRQTLTPRWFAAARVERLGTPVPEPVVISPVTSFLGVEETLGYRLTPDVTFRVSHRTRRQFGQTQFQNQLAGSIVWAHRWF